MLSKEVMHGTLAPPVQFCVVWVFTSTLPLFFYWWEQIILFCFFLFKYPGGVEMYRNTEDPGMRIVNSECFLLVQIYQRNEGHDCFGRTLWLIQKISLNPILGIVGEVSVFDFRISLSVCLLPSFGTHQLLLYVCPHDWLKDGCQFWNNPLWLRKSGVVDCEAALNKHGCQDPTAEATCVREAIQCISIIRLLYRVRQSIYSSLVSLKIELF